MAYFLISRHLLLPRQARRNFGVSYGELAGAMGESKPIRQVAQSRKNPLCHNRCDVTHAGKKFFGFRFMVEVLGFGFGDDLVEIQHVFFSFSIGILLV